MKRGARAMAIGVMAMVVTAGGVLTLAQQGGAGERAPGQPDIGMMLINGLRETEGCLGVDAGDMMSGKNVIIAWFENKAAVEKWYYSRTHLGALKRFIKTDVDHEPLEFVTDENAPIMVIASLTPSTREELAQVAMPISQISIELFAPLPGGAHLNGRLSPETFKVAHMHDLSDGAAGGGE